MNIKEQRTCGIRPIPQRAYRGCSGVARFFLSFSHTHKHPNQESSNRYLFQRLANENEQNGVVLVSSSSSFFFILLACSPPVSYLSIYVHTYTMWCYEPNGFLLFFLIFVILILSPWCPCDMAPAQGGPTDNG